MDAEKSRHPPRATTTSTPMSTSLSEDTTSIQGPINCPTISACNETLSALLSTSTKINQLLESMKKANPVISCRPCSGEGPEGVARAFLIDSSPLQIVLCSNRLKPSEVEEVVTHELVHAFDYTHSRCDFDSCEGLAYSEVRAARDAECAHVASFPIPLPWFKSQCVRYHASRSTASIFPAGTLRLWKNVVYLMEL